MPPKDEVFEKINIFYKWKTVSKEVFQHLCNKLKLSPKTKSNLYICTGKNKFRKSILRNT